MSNTDEVDFRKDDVEAGRFCQKRSFGGFHRDQRGQGDRVDKVNFLARIVSTWPNQEPLVTCHALGSILIGEVFVGSQTIRLILLDHGQLGDTTGENFAWVKRKRVLGQTDLLVSVLEFILTILVLLNFFILKGMLGISV